MTEVGLDGTNVDTTFAKDGRDGLCLYRITGDCSSAVTYNKVSKIRLAKISELACDLHSNNPVFPIS